jgi:hypothetical protein
MEGRAKLFGHSVHEVLIVLLLRLPAMAAPLDAPSALKPRRVDS